ncbi:SDR family oxidoreductase [Lentzea sp. NPDC059081]|uniref:SDR family oxidoreductase n=1 Tax=Lentzea sp. NPDC059081 TaxID=3346719 RepID=UPI0036C4E4C6
MPEDQYTRQDPRHQYPGPGSGVQDPDHGELTYRGSGRLPDTAAVITGGDSGIGRAVAIAFAREGADVVLSYLDDEQDDAERTAELVRAAGRRAVLVPGDLRTEEKCREVAERAHAEFGRIDVLVNNAGHQLMRDGGLLSVEGDQIDAVFRINVYAMFWLCKAAVPFMRPGSAIINTSSIQAFAPLPVLMDYAATKAAVVNFTKNLSTDLIGKGIRVNSVAPGPVWTPLTHSTLPAGNVDGFGSRTPLGRAAQPAELAPAFVFLASQESSYVSGEVLGVTGGDSIT